MSTGPIIKGIPFLAPDQQIVLTWGQYGGLHKYLDSNPIEITASFFRSSKPRWFYRKLTSTTSLDIQPFERSNSAEHGFGPNIAKELAILNKNIKAIEESVNQITQMKSE
jgi:hypothetical protein